MELSESLSYLPFAAISLATAAIAVMLTGYVQRLAFGHAPAAPGLAPDGDTPGRQGSGASGARGSFRYEFRDGCLVSEPAADDPFLGAGVAPEDAIHALAERLSDLHPDLAARIEDLAQRGEGFMVVGHMGPDTLTVSGRAESDRIVIRVTPDDQNGRGRALDAGSIHAIERETTELRAVQVLSGAVQWKQTEDGRVTWASEGYLRLCETLGAADDGTLTWPLPSIFGDQLTPPPRRGALRRCSLVVPNRDAPLWFEVAADDLEGGTVIYDARSIDRLVEAEAARRDFVQTLSKTFAALPIGLAVFDRKRELVLFNPALVTISSLDPGYLTLRPTLRAFLDQLRDRRRMPEPKDYRNWREEIARLEEGALAGNYHELWTLPGGASLRVTGRPHPGGAIAFMFEDISKEIQLTREYRGELDLARSISDDIRPAFAVFDRDGRERMTNAAYDRMWPDRSPDNGTGRLEDALRSWRAAFAPTGFWGDIRDFAAHAVDRSAWSEVLDMNDGRRMTCRVGPLRGGHTIVWFVPVENDLSDPFDGWLPLSDPGHADAEARTRIEKAYGTGAA